MKRMLLQLSVLISCSLIAKENKEISSILQNEKEHELLRVQQNGPIYDSIHGYWYMWSDSLSPIIKRVTTMSKDVDSDSIISTLSYYVEGNEKHYLSDVKSCYDAEGRLVKEVKCYWEIDAWIKNHETTYSYDTNGDMMTKISNNIDWGVVAKSEYFYNDQKKLIAEHTYTFYESTATWELDGKYTYRLDDKGRIRSSSFLVKDTEGNWYEASKQEVSYDHDGTFKEVLDYLWIHNLNIWRCAKTETWYGGDERPLISIYSDGSDDPTTFVPLKKVAYDYLPDSELRTTYEYSHSSKTWIKMEASKLFYRQTPTNILDKSIDNAIQLYPNPTTDKIIAHVPGASEYKIYDTFGNYLLSSSTPEIDVSHLPKGAYMLRISTKSGIVSKSFIKN